MSSELMLEPKLEGQQSALVSEFERWKSIESESELESAVALCLEGRGLVKNIQAFFAPMKHDAHRAWKGICDKETATVGKVESEVKRVQKLGDDFRTREHNRRMQEERARQEKERAEAAEKQRAAAEAALKRAAELEEQGRGDLAEKVMKKAEAIESAAPAYVEPVKVELPKQAGVSNRKVWDYVVLDSALVPNELKEISRQAVLNTIKIQALNGGTPAIPGLRIEQRVASSLRG